MICFSLGDGMEGSGFVGGFGAFESGKYAHNPEVMNRPLLSMFFKAYRAEMLALQKFRQRQLALGSVAFQASGNRHATSLVSLWYNVISRSLVGRKWLSLGSALSHWNTAIGAPVATIVLPPAA
jgi:hypothetical protein